MAATSATLTVNYFGNYNGPHRVCYRIGNSGPYTCILSPCAGGNCSQDISIMVDNETCPTVNINGYVQPTCEDVNSTAKRVAFSYDFIPNPTCKRYTVTCANVGVATIAVTNGASGYNPLSPPSVLISGGSGSGATATANVGAGGITNTAVPFDNNGSGYTNGSYTNVPLLGGTGSGAQASFTVVGGVVTSGTITAPGTGYTTGDSLSPDPSAMGPSTPVTPASFTINSNYGVVTSITVNLAGSGYTSAPAITIGVSGTGQQATATSALATCTDLVAPGCSGSPGVIPTVFEVGEGTSICSNTPPTIPAGFTSVENGNCACNCVTTTISVTGPVDSTIAYYYNKCNGVFVSGILSVGGSPSTITDCVVSGSVVTRVISGEAVANVVYGSSCS